MSDVHNAGVTVGVLIKWITLRVVDRAGFDQGQRAWSALRGEPGFLGQGGGWSHRDGDRAHIFGCWADRAGYDRWMVRGHDRMAAAQAGTYRELEARLFAVDGVPPDFAEVSLARIAHCQVRPDRRDHFVAAQATVWNPGMGAAPGCRHISFGQRQRQRQQRRQQQRQRDETDFLVLSLWRSPADHERYRTDRFPDLHRRSGASDDLDTVHGDLVAVESAWTVQSN